jgi:hypothetical protein
MDAEDTRPTGCVSNDDLSPHEGPCRSGRGLLGLAAADQEH